jgi:hypothetical protein
MFGYGTKPDGEGRHASRTAYRLGVAVLSVVVGAICLLSGRTVLGLGNFLLAISNGAWSLDKKRRTR